MRWTINRERHSCSVRFEFDLRLNMTPFRIRGAADGRRWCAKWRRSPASARQLARKVKIADYREKTQVIIVLGGKLYAIPEIKKKNYRIRKPESKEMFEGNFY